MKFYFKAEKKVMIDGKIVTFKAGSLDTTDEITCAALREAKDVKEVKATKQIKRQAPKTSKKPLED